MIEFDNPVHWAVLVLLAAVAYYLLAPTPAAAPLPPAKSAKKRATERARASLFFAG